MSAIAILGVVAASLGSLYLGFRGVAWLFGEISGWHNLETLWATKAGPPVWTHSHETVRVNAIRFRSCVDAGVQPDALYLRVTSIFHMKALRIPWTSMAAFQRDQVYGRPAIRFLVGGAAITVDMPLYAAMYPHIPGVR